MATTYLTPGVYIEEVPSGPKPIAGASTNVMAIVGPTTKGPTEPTRVTGWTDFEARFGPPVQGTFTAAAVYGFFDNGGPAAFIVRADESTTAVWEVTDSMGAAAFEITATSAGAWANGFQVVVAPDNGGAAGQLLYLLRDPEEAVTRSGSQYDVPTHSTVGLRPGDGLHVVCSDGTGPVEVTAVTVEEKIVTVEPASSDPSATPDLTTVDVVAVERGAAAGDQALMLSSGSGFKPAELIELIHPDRSRTALRLSAVAPTENGSTLTLDGPLAGYIPAAEFATRTVNYHGAFTRTGVRNLALGEITFDELPKPGATQLVVGKHRATAHNGMRAVWTGSANPKFTFPAKIAAGTVEIEASLEASLFSEDRAPGPLVKGEIDSRYGFLPAGTTLEFSGPSPSLTVTKTDGTFDANPGEDQIFDKVTFKPADPPVQVVVRCSHPIEKGDHIAYEGGAAPVAEVQSSSGNIYAIRHPSASVGSGFVIGSGPFPVKNVVASKLNPLRFSVEVTDKESTEVYPELSLDDSHPRFYAKDGIINDVSTRIKAGPRLGSGPPTAATMPTVATLTNPGSSNPATNASLKRAINRLDTETEPAMLIAPDVLTLGDDLLTADVIGAMTTHCRNFRRYAIVDLPDEDDDQDLLDWRLSNVASMYAGAFAPHLKIVNLDPTANEKYQHVPPSGFVAGVLARTDADRGVWKAPGNESVTGIVGPKVNYTDRRQDALNPQGINLIRAFAGRGTRVWGARNATDDTTWRYINVRRLFNFLENSIERGTQWVVFEPNDAKTWLRVRVSVQNFLNGVWRAGGLLGNGPDEAYSVRVGLGETMTETDIDLGLIIIEVAVRPVKPAEFVVFRFSHKRPEQ